MNYLRAMQGRKSIQPKMMYQVNLESLVPKDNFYRRLNSQLGLTFLYNATASYYGTEGQESIDPVVFFKICLIGYLNNINSDRKLIEFCANRLDTRLYLQYDIDESLPWHSTISRTRQLYGEEVFLQLFQEVLSLCVTKGMVRGKRQAIDSAFIKANASLDSLTEKEILEDVQVYAEELNEGSEYKISSSNHSSDKTEEEAKSVKKKTSNKTHYSTTDADARISIKPGKPWNLYYYAQISVDDSNHVITGANADFADSGDSQCLPKVLGQTIENLQHNDITIEQVLADTGYSSGDALRYIEKQGIEAYIPNPSGYIHKRDFFNYNKELDQYECIRGNKAVLALRRTECSPSGRDRKIYRSSVNDCKGCPLKESCLGNLNYKKITDRIDKTCNDRMHEKMQTAYGKRTSRIRSRTVEPVLGSLINFFAMKKVNGRGITQASKHVVMASIAYNLKKYIKFIYLKPGKALEACLNLRGAFKVLVLFPFPTCYSHYNYPLPH